VIGIDCLKVNIRITCGAGVGSLRWGVMITAAALSLNHDVEAFDCNPNPGAPSDYYSKESQ
jgi:hypothetical protein